MADTKISGLTAATTFLDADEFPVNEAGSSKKVTGTQLKAYIGDMLQNQATTDSTSGSSVDLPGSIIAIPSGGLRVGTVFEWVFSFSRDATQTIQALSIMAIIGPTGTHVDPALTIGPLTWLGQSAVVDDGLMKISITCRGPITTTCGFRMSGMFVHNADMSGLMGARDASTRGNLVSTRDVVTVPPLAIGLYSNAAPAIIIQQVIAEAKNL